MYARWSHEYKDFTTACLTVKLSKEYLCIFIIKYWYFIGGISVETLSKLLIVCIKFHRYKWTIKAQEKSCYFPLVSWLMYVSTSVLLKLVQVTMEMNTNYYNMMDITAV